MKNDQSMKALLCLIALLLFLNLATGFFGSRSAQAVPETVGRGKYQISSWSTGIGTYGYHIGYYVLDTTTGRVVDSRDETHDITEEIQKTITTKPLQKGAAGTQ